jgi:hypothetical protein
MSVHVLLPTADGTVTQRCHVKYVIKFCVLELLHNGDGKCKSCINHIYELHVMFRIDIFDVSCLAVLIQYAVSNS